MRNATKHCLVTKMESLPNIPQSNRGEKPATVNYCPRCGTKAQGDADHCTSCGRDFAHPSALGMADPGQMRSVLKRPAGVTIICVLWFFGGLINFFGGLGSLGDDLNALSMLGSFPSDINFWASWAIPLETMLVAATVIMGLLQFSTIYGLWNGKRWSRKYALALPAGFLLVNWAETLLLMAAPASVGAWPDFTSAIFGTVIAVVVISYLKKEHVKKYLGGE